MFSITNHLSCANVGRLIFWSLALISISSPRAGAQNADQPFDFELKDGWPRCEVGGWHPWPGHWNLDPVDTGYHPPAASIALAEDDAKLTYTVMAGGGDGYRGDYLQIFESAPGARFVVTANARKTVLRKPDDPKAAPVEETYMFTSVRSFDTLAGARAAVAAVGAETLSQVPAPLGRVGNGVYLAEGGTSSVYSTVQADSWRLIAKAGTPQTIAGFPDGFRNNDNGMAGQIFSGDVPFDLSRNQGRQIMMERWTLQITAANNYRLELQSLAPIDVPSTIPTAEVEPLFSTANRTDKKSGRAVSARLMYNYNGEGWRAALGRAGCRFRVTAHSALSPITKVELQAKPPGKGWVTLTTKPELLNDPTSKLKDYTENASVCLGDVVADKPMIPLDLSLTGVWSFQTIATNALGETATSPLADVNVVLPLNVKIVQAQTLAPIPGSDGGNGWFKDSEVKDYEFRQWTDGL